MSNQDKVNIYEILDMFNKAVGYKGLDNTGKNTDERDDVISRQTFINWIREYNATHSRPIRGEKINQYNNEWFKSDIEKLIQDKKVQKRLTQAYLRNTVDVFKGLEDINISSNVRVSKDYMQTKNEMHGQALDELIKEAMNHLTDEVIENHFAVFFGNKKLKGTSYINKEKIIEGFIDEKKIEEEAFKEIDNYYETPEYDDTGNIIGIHHSQKRPSTDYFLKNV